MNKQINKLWVEAVIGSAASVHDGDAVDKLDYAKIMNPAA